MIVTRNGEPPQQWPKVQVKLTPTRFKSGDVMLTGLLIEPPDAKETKPPLVVCVHGQTASGSSVLFGRVSVTHAGPAEEPDRQMERSLRGLRRSGAAR